MTYQKYGCYKIYKSNQGSQDLRWQDPEELGSTLGWTLCSQQLPPSNRGERLKSQAETSVYREFNATKTARTWVIKILEEGKDREASPIVCTKLECACRGESLRNQAESI